MIDRLPSVGAKASATNTNAPRNAPYVVGVGRLLNLYGSKLALMNTSLLVLIEPWYGSDAKGRTVVRDGASMDFRLVLVVENGID